MIVEQDVRVNYPLKNKKKRVFSANEIGKISRNWRDNQPVYLEIPEDLSISEVMSVYSEFPEVDFLPVTNSSGKPVGYLKKKDLHALLSQNKYSRELMMRPEMKINSVYEKRIAIIDCHQSLSEASKILMNRDEEIRFDPFVIACGSSIFGIANVRDVLDGINYYMEKDLNAVSASQRKLMQDHPDSETRLNVTRYTRQMNQGVGGDYLDISHLNQELSVAVHFDIVGKGIKAFSMVMALGAIFKSLLTFNEQLSTKDIRFDFSTILKKINSILYKITPEEMYAAGTVAFIDTKNMLLKLYDFGHGMTWLKRSGLVYSLYPKNPPQTIPFLGISPEIPLSLQIYKLCKNDLLYSVSDGIVETKNTARESFGTERIVSLLKNHEYHELSFVLQEELSDFREGYRITDDMSFYGIKI